ncbi:CU044_2847 family protein [Streptomyces sp.]|uniref:CU044_2847 family protein n=1 Tax=Streptomyces sp. TaxID=1931 RepID=UPI002F4053B6
MAQTVTIDLGDGSAVEAEIIGDVPFERAEEAGGYGDVGAGRRAAELGSAVALTLDQVRATVRSVGRWAAETVAEGGAAGAPDSFEVEFGLKLAVKSGQLLGIIAEAGSEAGLTVRLSWDLAARRSAQAVGTPPVAGRPEGGAGTEPGTSTQPGTSTGTGTGTQPGTGTGTSTEPATIADARAGTDAGSRTAGATSATELRA